MWNDPAGLPPFRRKDGKDHQLTDADIRRLLANGVLVRLAHGLLVGYRRGELAIEKPAELALRVQAMQRRYPIGYAGFRTAAALHRLWLIGGSGPVHLVRVRGYPREKHDVLVETADLPPEHRCVVEGVAATSLVRTTVDVCGRLEPGEGLSIIDSALRRGATKIELEAVCEFFDLHDGSRVRELVALGDPASQSALESVSRWLFHEARLPPPELQTLIGDAGGPFASVDFYWKREGVVGESDGLLKYDNDPDDPVKAELESNALRREKLRQERLERMGLIVVRWTFDDAVNHPHNVVERVRDALQRGARRRSGAA